MNFQDQTILITGGAQGIGKSIVQSFLNLNAKVIALDIDPIEKTLFDHHENLVSIKLDLASPEKIDDFCLSIKDKKIDTFIGNAGILSYKNIDNFSHQDAHQIFDVNLLGHLKLIQSLKNNIAQSDSKKIILLSSINAQFGTPGSILYNMTKASIESAVKSLCVDLADQQITVNGIAPGFIKTRMSVLADGTDEFENDDFKEIYLKQKKLPIGRYGEPQDIANVAVFLASPLANYINGQIINVDGGVTSTF